MEIKISDRLRAQLEKERQMRHQMNTGKEEQKETKAKQGAAPPQRYDEFADDEVAQRNATQARTVVDDDGDIPSYGDDLSSEDEGEDIPPAKPVPVAAPVAAASPVAKRTSAYVSAPLPPPITLPVRQTPAAPVAAAVTDTPVPVPAPAPAPTVVSYSAAVPPTVEEEVLEPSEDDDDFPAPPTYSDDDDGGTDNLPSATPAPAPSASPLRPTEALPQQPPRPAFSPGQAPPQAPPAMQHISIPPLPADDEDPPMHPMMRTESVAQGMLMNRSISNQNLATNRRPLTGRPSFSPEGSLGVGVGAEDELTRALVEAERDVLEWRHNFRATISRYPTYKDVLEDRSKTKENIRTKLKAYRDLRRKKLATAKPF